MAEKKTKKEIYYEPADFFPKAIRKKYGLGEFNTDDKKPAKKAAPKKSTTKKK